MFVLEGVTYGIVAAVFLTGMYFICLRMRRDQREIRDLLRATTPLPTASIVMIVAAVSYTHLTLPTKALV